MKSTVALVGLSAVFFGFTSCKEDVADDYIAIDSLAERYDAGGATTVYLTSSNAFSTPASNLSGEDLDLHLFGDVEFEAAFVTAPAEVNGGIGTIFNNTSCISCHPKDGRSAFPTNINSLSGFFLRISAEGTDEHGGPNPMTGYGTQVQNQAIFGYEPEAKFQVSYTQIVETLADGTEVVLQKPNYNLVENYIPFESTPLLSPRLAPPVFGLGLLEAISETSILVNEDVNDVDGDGISGKANYVFDASTQSMQLGRFGWKANTASILEQCAGAYNHDMGITNYLFPTETGYGQTNGYDGLDDDAEITDDILDAVAFYCKTIAVPAPRNLENESVLRGAAIFDALDCAKCHVPSMQTGSSDITALSNQTIWPYSDMLLHDMGEELADNRPDFLANGQEWKTRPLWGIGLTNVVNGHTNFLHDGRAKNITEAILWHGGEAQASKESFKALSTQDRADLLAFINAL
ncbi:CxxC motif-containing protein, DUF1111 family [Pustulibacterium marinum]|uniref:CxxC motif-containing protein, DUF1111 family n=1 Tax=Pustulibacterium marinum TaxID=1224947 RepID=A0A1I7EYJ9_9FLAO|nr:di-heme oxidoredictase family protein [Pustulibacterium marinum]SFU29012.1 CxxC motif-containing protein, DUF1111 family [Pustulibacterium marinum]